MLIESEKILEAKEKLGDENAFIMAEALGLDDFDERNLKACCPYHEEDTPSFIYDKKRMRFHCFSCQKTVDILDVFMEKGMTYIEACEKLFELAKIPYSFGEKGVRTKAQYRYPKQEQAIVCDQIEHYLGLRGISPETIRQLDIRQDNRGNCVFNYYDTNDVLTMVKYRPSHAIDKQKGEIKNWAQKDADTAPLLYNMNKINVAMPLLITEGEIDCAAAIECGYHNTVSVPFGAGNYTWIEHNWDWLEQFESIIIASDNDEAGQKMRKEVVYRLGSWRCKVVEIPTFYEKEDGKRIQVSDINEMMYWFGKDEVLKAIINAKDQPVASVVDFSDVSEVDLSEIDGIYTGIEMFDRELMRLFYGTFNVFTGTNGAGKSSFLCQLICQSVDQGKDAWMYSKELPNYMSKNWITPIFAGNRHIKKYIDEKNATYPRVTPEARTAINDYYRGHIYLYKDDYGNTVEEVKISMEDSARKYGCKLFIIDNLTAINMNCTDNEKWSKQVDLVNWCIDFAKKFHVVVILVIHPKKIETMRRLTKFDVQGLGSIVDLAHRLISLYRVTPKDKAGERRRDGRGWFREPIKYDVMCDILKDRMRGRENLSIGLYYDPSSRRFFTNEKEYAYQYKWDNINYSTPLPKPKQLYEPEEEEVFGHVYE